VGANAEPTGMRSTAAVAMAGLVGLWWLRARASADAATGTEEVGA
jgi:hypothetical protein